jgi:hypothetical protein
MAKRVRMFCPTRHIIFMGFQISAFWGSKGYDLSKRGYLPAITFSFCLMLRTRRLLGWCLSDIICLCMRVSPFLEKPRQIVVDSLVESLPDLLQLLAHCIGRQSHSLEFQEGSAEFAGGHASKDFSSTGHTVSL